VWITCRLLSHLVDVVAMVHLPLSGERVGAALEHRLRPRSAAASMRP
jgi:hypothetical protein